MFAVFARAAYVLIDEGILQYENNATTSQLPSPLAAVPEDNAQNVLSYPPTSFELFHIPNKTLGCKEMSSMSNLT